VSRAEVFLSGANRSTAQSSGASRSTLSLAGLAITKDRSSRWQKLCFAVLAAALIGYALLTGMHTLNQDDLFWMLATARWIVQNREIPWTDHFSYTAQGQPWIYPVGGSLLFYGVWLIGGYAALCWLGAVSMATTTALLLRSSLAISAALAALALPVIATRMEVRADAFTTALFAASLATLWRYHETGRARLWVLPVLMVVWANAHPGFPAGLAVIVGYAGVEALELIWPGRRRAAVDRLRRAWPWLFLCFPATGLNPFGWWIYAGVLRQLMAPLMPLQVEWQPIRLAWLSLSLQDANGAFTLTLVAGATAVAVALWHRRLGAAALLITLAAVAFRHYRFEAIFAIAAVIVGGAVLATVIPRKPWSTGTVVGAAVALACIRSYDLVTDHYPYYAPATHFGSGLSPAFPERADAFIEQEGIPGPILNVGMVGGGYFVWQLGPRYLDFVDGRALPFSTKVSLTPGELLGAPPSAPVWRRTAERYGVNTVLFTFSGLDFLLLWQFCISDEWVPVYLDQTAAIFVHRRPENEDLIRRLRINCAIGYRSGAGTRSAILGTGTATDLHEQP
jgi:hypothetical protein